MAVASLDNDDMGEDDFESNIIQVRHYVDAATGEHGSGEFILPADSYRDVTALEWILSIKSSTDSTTDLFNDLVHSHYK